MMCLKEEKCVVINVKSRKLAGNESAFHLDSGSEESA